MGRPERDSGMSWLDDLAELRTLVRETYDFWRKWAEDHHCKSGEGTVSIHWPSVWAEEWDAEPGCEVYSYVFGPHRSHFFDSIKEARDEFQRWADRFRGDFEPCPTEDCDGWYEPVDGWGSPVAACNICLGRSAA